MSAVPDIESQNINDLHVPPTRNKKRKRKNKNKNKSKPLTSKKKIFKHKPVNSSVSKVVFTMSSWAEHFTFAATWQLKHQLAYWKAKAKSLEYENGVLHDIIRRNHSITPGANSSKSYKMGGFGVDEESIDCEDARHMNVHEMPSPNKDLKLGKWENIEDTNTQTMSVDLQSDSEEDSSDANQDIEVSEEFIQFLMVNAKHKEEMRLERQRLIASEEQAAMEKREAKLKASRHYGLSAQELYGDKWQKISALEISMKSNFMSKIDSNKPAYWPVIPLNFDMHSSSNQNM